MIERSARVPRGVADRFGELNWGIITILCAIAFIGVVMHFSVSSGEWSEMPLSHGVRFAVMLLAALTAALLLKVRSFWLWISFPLYFGAVMLLVAVWAVGETRMGAQRWLSLGPVSLQPSEIMKVAIVLALAHFYQIVGERRPGWLWQLWHLIPLAMIAAPVLLVMLQPDLGTASMILFSGLAIMFMAGLAWRIIVPALVLGAGVAIYAYNNLLHGYQRDRVNVFLGITEDPLGAGYHVLQSKIAIGSAGFFGRGYLQGSQAQGDFLPEKHTDFIFTMIVEEFGFFGGAIVLGLFGALMWLTMQIADRARSRFGELVAGGIAATLACYVFINTAMVIGLVPVVGIPLPLVSFGGTAMMTVLAGYAIVLAIDLHKER